MTSVFQKSVMRVGLVVGLLLGGVASAIPVANGDFSQTDNVGACLQWNAVSTDVCAVTDAGLPSGGGASGVSFLPGVLSQELTTQTGHTYILEFRLYNDAFPDNALAIPAFTWSAGNQIDVAPDLSSLIVADFTLLQGSFLAVADTTTLSFYLGPTASLWLIDDVSVTERPSQIPEPATVFLFALALIAFETVRRTQERRNVR